MEATTVRAHLRPPRHPGPWLAEDHRLGPDIYRGLLSWVLESECYQQWRTSEKNWQLGCYGVPGCGKTTLSAMVVSHLRESYAGEHDAVAALFVHEDVQLDGVSFLEDLLTSIFQQLCQEPTTPRGVDAALADYAAYLNARRQRQGAATRLALVRRALAARLSRLANAFLVFDGLDRCVPGTAFFVQEELTRLRRLGLRVMTTSRLPWLRDSFSDYCCDGGDECPGPDNPRVYWECQKCLSAESFLVCCACYSRGCPCFTCGTGSHLSQPFDHVDLDISLPSEEQVRKFVAWALEHEHGDLGLDSDAAEKPPLSLLGRRLRDGGQGAAEGLVAHITSQAENNIALARARLELVHAVEDVAAAGVVRDRLPPNVSGLFDAILACVEAQPPSQRELGLKAIAAVGHDDHVTVEAGALMEWLDRAAAWAGTIETPHRSLEDVLDAARGCLITTVPMGEQERFVLPFHDDFRTYINEGYRESLIWATAELGRARKAGLEKPKPSQTFQVGVFLRRIGATEELLNREPLHRIMRRQTGIR